MAYRDGSSRESFIVSTATRWRQMAKFPPRPFYPSGKYLQYKLNRRLGGPPKNFLDDFSKNKSFALARFTNPGLYIP